LALWKHRRGTSFQRVNIAERMGTENPVRFTLPAQNMSEANVQAERLAIKMLAFSANV